MLSVSANDKSPVTLPEKNESKLVVNELLCFVTNKNDNHPKSVIHDTIVEFYREDEIFAAKQTLTQCGDFTNCPSVQPHLKKRIGENKVERIVDDILTIFTALDECDERSRLPVFCVPRHQLLQD